MKIEFELEVPEMVWQITFGVHESDLQRDVTAYFKKVCEIELVNLNLNMGR